MTGTVWQQNAANFATRLEDRDLMLARIRHNAIDEVVPLLGEGDSRAAYLRLMRGLMDQLAAAGMSWAAVPGLPSECGGPSLHLVRA